MIDRLRYKLQNTGHAMLQPEDLNSSDSVSGSPPSAAARKAEEPKKSYTPSAIRTQSENQTKKVVDVRTAAKKPATATRTQHPRTSK